MMVETMGRCDTPKENITNLLCVRQMHFPDQPDHFAASFSFCVKENFRERMQFLIMCSMATNVEALAFEVWRDFMTNVIHSAEFNHGDNGNISIIQSIRAKVAHFEDKYLNLQDITTILELALWKMRMNGNIPQEKATQRKTKINVDESDHIHRQSCRISCGADVVTGHVMPYLISAED
jgi:hypothetical protein